MAYDTLPDLQTIQKTIDSLKSKNISATLANNAEEAKKFALNLIPQGAQIMNMTSVTLSDLGLVDEINKSGQYDSVRNKLTAMDQMTQAREKRQLGAAPDYVIGSVHAVTSDGAILIASKTGSQLPAYAYGADKVIFIVGAQKIVKDLEDGMKRIYEHTLPLENIRAQKAYGTPSSVNKILIIDREVTAERIHLIFVNQVLGF